VVKTHMMPYLYRSFSQKSHIICGSFAKITCNLRHPMGLRHPLINDCHKYDASLDVVLFGMIFLES